MQNAVGHCSPAAAAATFFVKYCSTMVGQVVCCC
jgi:hypothetical protein